MARWPEQPIATEASTIGDEAQPDPQPQQERPGPDQAPTLATKLQVPGVPRHLVLRERLFDALDRGARDRLLLLCAPAGAGKTVLLSSWIAARRLPGPHCWLSLDHDDDDASRLIADMLSALKRSGELPADSALMRIEPPRGADTEGLLPRLINGLADLRDPIVLVLDEVHELSSPQANATLDFLVRHAPPQLRLVLATRSDPALPIERLRLGGELTELRVGDLAFTRAETSELCERLELELSETDVDLLWSRTEGWPAGLRFATFSLRDHPEPARFLAGFAGTDRALADYLVSEVLGSLPLDMRDFMLRTCLVDHLSAPLADALTGLEGGGLMLSRLEHVGALLSRVDNEGAWYRYHPLFAELLRARLRFAHSEEVPLLHRRAARWYAANDSMMRAIRHALAAEDWEHAAEMVASHWLELFLRGQSYATRSLMARLPVDLVEADPKLAAAFAGSRLEDGEVDSADRFLAVARNGSSSVSSDASQSFSLTLGVVELERARMGARLEEAERLAHRLCTPLSGADSDAGGLQSQRSVALSALGATELWAGERRDAALHLERALALATESGDDRVTLNCLSHLAIADLMEGKLTRAHEKGTKALELCERHSWREGPASACAHLAAATISFHLGELEDAQRLARRADGATTAAECALKQAIGVLRARIMTIGGEPAARDAALKLSAIGAAMAEQPPASFLEIALRDAHARALLAAGELEQAHAMLTRPGVSECPPLLLCRAALELREGAHEQVETSLGPLLYDERASVVDVHPAWAVEGWLLLALARHAGGDEPGCIGALDQALGLAEREPYRDAFLLGGPQVWELLERQAQTGTLHPALLESLLDRVDHAPDAIALREPLTEREQRILRYLPTMLSNAEIGAEIFVSLNTVKTHLRSIYRKLDASGRADAVEKARQLHLLPAGIRRPRVMQRL
jgi:LuxR family transcriptional regulator, maltose regulon positive regulatory protein